jgi:hypothetical protein
MVFQVFKKILLPITIINFLFASLKLLKIFKNAYWNSPQNSLLFDWLMFSTVVLTSHWLQGKCAWVNLSQAASCKHFQCQNRGFRVFGVGCLKDRVSEAGLWKDFKIIKSFQRCKLKFCVWFFHQPRNKNGKNYERMYWYRKLLFINISRQKILISWHNP